MMPFEEKVPAAAAPCESKWFDRTTSEFVSVRVGRGEEGWGEYQVVNRSW